MNEFLFIDWQNFEFRMVAGIAGYLIAILFAWIIAGRYLIESLLLYFDNVDSVFRKLPIILFKILAAFTASGIISSSFLAILGYDYIELYLPVILITPVIFAGVVLTVIYFQDFFKKETPASKGW